MIKRLSRLAWAAGLALLVLVALQTALDGYTAAGAEAGGEKGEGEALLASTQAITITYWHQHPLSSDRGMFMEQLIAEFNATNLYSITVQGQYIGGYGDVHDEVIAGLRADGPLPNVVVAYPNSMADFARYGAVHFLDDYLDDPVAGMLDIPDFSPGVLDYYRLSEYGNQLAGLQHGRSIEVMYYNTHLITSAGITIPITWGAFETACISLTTEAVSGTIPTIDASRFATWLWSRGGELLSDDMNLARFDEQPGIESLLLFQELINGGYARLPYDRHEEQASFANGQVGFTFGSSTGIPYYRAAMESGANHAWGVTRVPAVPGHEVVDSYGGGLGILHESEETDLAAWRFIRWLTEPEQTARWAARSGYFPVRISAGTHPSVTQKLAEDPQYAQAYALLPLGRGEPGVRGYNDIRGILNDAMTEILQNGADVNETLRAAADEADAILAASGPDSAIIPPSGGTLVYTNTQYLSATVEFPAGALATTQTVSYVPLDDLPTDGLAFALVPNMTFSRPVTITIYYRDEDVAGMDETRLKLYNYDWSSGSWIEADPCGGYVTDTVNNILQAAVCHFSDYAMMDWPYGVSLYVAITGTDSGNCSTPVSACLTIQYAVDQAGEGDEVRVAAGTYTGVSARAGITQVAYISKTVTVSGGYTTTNWITSHPITQPTTLDAQGQGRVLYITGDISPTIEGLRITGGDAAGLGGFFPWTGADFGGGLYLITATATISNNWVFSNTALFGGGLGLYFSDATLNRNTVISNCANYDAGGLYLYFSNATLAGNTVAANTGLGSYGGGLFLNRSAATLSGNTVISNTTSGTGGGMLLIESDATLDGNTVIFNTADFGGGLFLGHSNAALTNNVLADNQADGAGSGLYIQRSSPHLLHTTIAHNHGGDGSGVYVTSSGLLYYSNVAMTNTILVSHTVGITVTAGNTATLEATLWGDGAWANDTDWEGAGTIITGTPAYNYWGDPAFLNPYYGDYHIGSDSAAVDAGVDAGVSVDIDGEPRPAGGGYDIGADEFQHTVTPPALSSLPDQVFDHSTSPTSTIDLWAYAWDAQTPVDVLTYTVEGTPPTGAGVTLDSNRYVYVNPSTDWCGRTDVTIRVTDPGGLWDSDTFRVAVTWSCQGPLPVAGQHALRDEPITIDLTTYEPQVGDGTGLSWYVTGEDHCTVSGEYSDDDVLTFTPQAGFVGSDTVTLRMVYPWGSEARQELTLAWGSGTCDRPGVPVLVAPVDGSAAGGNRPTFEWGAVIGAEEYQIQVDDDADFSSPEREKTTASTDYTPASGLGGGVYYWRVRASNACGTDSWSAIWEFTVLTASPLGLNLHLPVVAREYR